jgi:molybdate transport system regulatory protein
MVRKAPAVRVALKPRFRVVCGEGIALGPGKMELLALLLETKSLSEAARRLEMSYMRAWTLVKEMNQCFREPVAVASRGGKTGGGMTVTTAGRRVVSLYSQIESRALRAANNPWRSLRKLLRTSC